MTDTASRRVLVTGGAGFIGSHLVERLVALGDDVVVLDDMRNGSPENLAGVASRIALVRDDCSAAAGILGEGRFDVVFHLGAPAYVPPSIEEPLADMRGSVEQTILLLEAMRRLERAPRVVHASSAAIYGSPAQQIHEGLPPAPVSPYGVDKFAAEEHVRVAALLHGIEAVILRYFSVYGPRQRKQVVYDLIRKVQATPTAIEVFGTGAERRDLTFVDDVVNATLIAAERAPGRGEAYNVGTGVAVTIADVVAAVARAMRATPEVRYTGSVRPGDPDSIVADVSRLRALGYAPAVALEAGVARTVAWALGRSGDEEV